MGRLERQCETRTAITVWGDCSALAAGLEPDAVALVEAVDVRHGHTLFDVAAGDGNAAFAAARVRCARDSDGSVHRASATRPEVMRTRSERGGVKVADAERLPFRADACERVISAFGVIFARRPYVAVGELFARVGAAGL